MDGLLCDEQRRATASFVSKDALEDEGVDKLWAKDKD
jgi:hypothetical protein